MSIYAGMWMAENNPLGAPNRNGRRRRNRRKFTIPWRLLVTPGGTGIYGLHTAVAFEVFRWLCRSAAEFYSPDVGGWGNSGPIEVLSRASCVGMDRVAGFGDPDSFMDDLRRRFLHALFETPRSQAVVDWRRKIGLSVDKSREIEVLHYSPQFTNHPLSSVAFQAAIGRLLSVRGLQLQHRWNSCHPDAVWVCGNSLCPSVKSQRNPHTHDGWTYTLGYSYQNDSSSWCVAVSHQERGENFHDFIVRCNLILDTLVYDPLPFECGHMPAETLQAVHDSGCAGPLQPLQLAYEAKGPLKRSPPPVVPRLEQEWLFSARLSGSGHETAVLGVKADSRAKARDLAQQGIYRMVRVNHDKRPLLDLDTIKAIRVNHIQGGST